MSTSETTPKTKRIRPRPELSIFEEELNVPFNKKEFLPDLPPHARQTEAKPVSLPAQANLPAPDMPAVAVQVNSSTLPLSVETVSLASAEQKNLGQSQDKLRTSAPSSSSFIDLENLKTTTTSDPELFDDARVQLSPDWVGVDFSPLMNVGFSRAHLVQLAKQGKLSATEVQDSIHFFAFDLKRNGKGKEIKGPPLNFFMGILRKGLPYAPPENFECPEAEARRRYLDARRCLEEQRQAEERELQELEYSEWRRALDAEELNSIVPEVVRHVPKAQESSLRAHFDENVWPARRAAIQMTIEHERAEIGRQIDQAIGEARE